MLFILIFYHVFLFVFICSFFLFPVGYPPIGPPVLTIDLGIQTAISMTPPKNVWFRGESKPLTIPPVQKEPISKVPLASPKPGGCFRGCVLALQCNQVTLSLSEWKPPFHPIPSSIGPWKQLQWILPNFGGHMPHISVDVSIFLASKTPHWNANDFTRKSSSLSKIPCCPPGTDPYGFPLDFEPWHLGRISVHCWPSIRREPKSGTWLEPTAKQLRSKTLPS